MNVYKVIRRLVNINDGIIAVDAAVADQYGDKLKSIGKGCYQVLQPVQLPKDIIFGHDKELYPFNVKKVSQDKLMLSNAEVPKKLQPKPVNMQTVNDIIMVLDDLDEEKDFTGAGKPEVKSVEALLGRSITAAERDEAWSRYQDQQ